MLNKKLVLFFLIPALIVVGYYFIVHKSMKNKIGQLNNLALFDTVYMATNGIDCFNNELTGLIKQKAFYDAAAKTVLSDSISMFINITDSSVCLILNGLTIHKAKITGIYTDGVLNAINMAAYNKIFSVPLKISNTIATIQKEPIIYKKAPKDTAEANNSIHKPDTTAIDPAFAIFTLTHDIKLIFEQDQNNTNASKKVFKKIKKQQQRNCFINNVKSVLKLNVPKYSPTIELKLSATDIVPIYRALPLSPYVVIVL